MRISGFFCSTLKISEGFMCGSFSRCQARHLSEILPNTQNSVDRKEDKDDEKLQGARVELMKDKQVLNLLLHRTNAFPVF